MDASSETTQFANTPTPPSERGAWLVACGLALLGVVVLVAVLAGVFDDSSAAAPPPPLLIARVSTPRAGATNAGTASAGRAGSSSGASASAGGAGSGARSSAIVQSPSSE